jgi:MFS family permease
MGYAYLGLGLGGVVSPTLANYLISALGWRHAIEVLGIAVLMVLIPVGLVLTRSTPAEMGLLPYGSDITRREHPRTADPVQIGVKAAILTANFWLILIGATLVIGAINAVIQNYVLFLKDQGYSTATASHFMSALLAASLGGRVTVGYIADRFNKKNTMALFYLLLGGSIPLLFIAHQLVAAWAFALAFGIAMGADYMLIPLVTAECFGLGSLAKILALIISGYSVGQWVAPWAAGRLFDVYHSYNLAWGMITVAAVLGAGAIYAVSVPSGKGSPA